MPDQTIPDLHRPILLKEAIPADAGKTIVSGAEIESESALNLKPHGFILLRE